MFRLTIPAMLLGTGMLAAQTAPVDKVVVPLSDPARPVTLRVGLVQGSISVKSGAVKDVTVEARPRSADVPKEATRDGMKRITVSSTGLEVEEENNNVRVSAASHSRSIDIAIIVPARTSVKLSTVNDGDITVEGVSGEIETNNTNGNVTLTRISGSAVAHALNGNLKVTFAQVEARPMSFSSLNGTIDVTFPAALKANVKMKSDQGEVFSDFDITMTASPKPVVEDARNTKGRYRVRLDKSIYGTINGGGPEISFSNLNGTIYIRKAGAAAAK